MVNTSSDSAKLRIDMQHADARACENYRSFAGQRVTGAAQTPVWYETWLAASGQTGRIIWVFEGDRPVAALPLVEARRHGVTILEFAGGGHANGNFCPCAGTSLQIPLSLLARAVKDAAPHIAMISLERQHRVLAGQENFLASQATRSSPNIALAASLEGGFAKLLERANGKKKAKKRRLQLRRFEEVGAQELRSAATIADIDQILPAFFEMKQARFKKAGIADVFAEPHIRKFWRDLFVASLDEPARPFSLEVLLVAGKPRAITGSSLLADRSVCEFGAISDDELTSVSPGEFLAYSNIETACAKGLSLYDFSVGDEAYKRSWCDMQITHFDMVMPVSVIGRVMAAGSSALVATKQRVKSNPRLLRAARAVQRLR